MKTTIEINGFEIVISETEGAIVVSAIKEDETIEEFTIEIEGDAQAQAQAQAQELQDFAQEEPDFAQDMQGQAQMQGQGQAQMQMQADEDEIKLESFDSFFNKRK
jgi:hypothetical protein